MTQMAVRATYVTRGTGMMPVADDAGGKNQQHDQRQRNPEYPNRLPHCHLMAGAHFWSHGKHVEPMPYARVNRVQPLAILS